MKAPESLPGTSQIRREFGEASEEGDRYERKPKVDSPQILLKSKSEAITQPAPKEVPQPRPKGQDTPSRERELSGSDRADPSPRNSRIL